MTRSDDPVSRIVWEATCNKNMQVNGIKLKRCGIIGYGSGWGIAHVIYGVA